METEQAGRSSKTEAACSPMLTLAPVDMIAAKGWGAVANQTEVTEAATGPGWLAHVKAGPRVRGRETIKSHGTPKSAST